MGSSLQPRPRTGQEVVRQVLGGKRKRDAGWQQQRGDVDAEHGQHDDEGGQQRGALACGDDRAAHAVVQAALFPQGFDFNSSSACMTIACPVNGPLTAGFCRQALT